MLVQCLWSLAAALSLAWAAVLQHGEAQQQPMQLAFSFRLLRRLAQRPLWLLGTTVELVGVVAQGLALRAGPVATMQAVKSCSVVIALVIAARRRRRRMTTMDALVAVGLVAAIAVFVSTSSPTVSVGPTSSSPWLEALVLSVGIGGGALVACRFVAPRSRAILIGTATGVIWAFTSILLKATALDVQHRGFAAMLSWTTWALVAGGVVGNVVNQTAFQAGDLSWSLPAISVVEPLVAAVFGAVVYREHIAGATAGARLLVGSAAIVALACVVSLDRPRAGGTDLM